MRPQERQRAMAGERSKQEFALVHAHLGCFGQKRVIRIPVFHLGLPQVKVWLNVSGRAGRRTPWLGCRGAAGQRMLRHAEPQRHHSERRPRPCRPQRGDPSVFWLQASRGCDAAALNYAER
jgi:hypothetical protein